MHEDTGRTSRGAFCCSVLDHPDPFLPGEGKGLVESAWWLVDVTPLEAAVELLVRWCSVCSSLTTCVSKKKRKSFSSLKISSWCLESARGSVYLIRNLNLIARAL